MRRYGVIAALGSLLIASCGERDPRLDEGFDLLAPTTIDDHVVLVDRSHERAYVVDVGSTSPEPSPVIADLPPSPLRAEPRNGHPDEAIVLCAGRPDDGRREKESAGLAVIARDGLSRTYAFDAPFNSWTQSADGRRVFLFFDPTVATGSDSLLQNQSEVAIIDLDAEPGENNPTLRTLDSFGDVPTRAVFSPPMTIAGAERELAIVLFDSDIAIWDMSNMDRPAYTVRLAPGARTPIELDQVVFGRAEPRFFLRGNASDNVFLINLEPASPDRQNDFQPSVNHRSAGTQPSDFILYEEPNPADASQNAHRLFVIAESSQSGTVVNTASNEETHVSLPAPMNHILEFTGDDDGQQRALLTRDGGDSVVFVDLEGLEDAGGRNLELVRLRSPYGRVVKLSDRLVLLVHQGQGLSLLDLVERTVQPMQSSQNLLTATAAHDKLWLAPAGDQRVGFLDLDTFHPSELRIDAPIRSSIAVPSPTAPRFVVLHDSSIGYLTVMDAGVPSLDTAYSLRGFLVDDLLGGTTR